MGYAVKELVYTLQGEGAQTGRPAVFVRFAGCNLWSGREEDRAEGPGGCAAWCDTDFVGTDGPGGGTFASAEELARAVAAAWPGRFGDRHSFPGAGALSPETAGNECLSPNSPLVVCTGGEPLLQMDDALVEALHAAGFEVAVETNGSLPPPAGLDWICVSPKVGAELALTAGDELKLVFPQPGAEPERFEELAFDRFYLQPMDGPDRDENTRRTLAYCLEHPRWRLSLQTQKYLGIP